MRIVKGKKVVDEDIDLRALVSGYKSVVVDIGTGDGRFVYKMARQQPETFFIGVDSAADNMAEYSSKAVKKPGKGGLSNAIYVVASAENLPSRMEGIAGKIFVILPWGSLLEGIVKGERVLLSSIRSIAAPEASLELFFTYSHLIEVGEMNRRELPELSLEYIENNLASLYMDCGIRILDKEIISNERLREYETQWAKRLGFGRNRTVYHVTGVITSPQLLRNE
ncbi:MAG: 16S rRNA (adenine(1408)-N(1))-methyltransferase NpmA [Bacillota bacterium]